LKNTCCHVWVANHLDDKLLDCLLSFIAPSLRRTRSLSVQLDNTLGIFLSQGWTQELITCFNLLSQPKCKSNATFKNKHIPRFMACRYPCISSSMLWKTAANIVQGESRQLDKTSCSTSSFCPPESRSCCKFNLMNE